MSGASIAGPAWLTAADELPHDPGPDTPPLWSENYLSYVWSPTNAVGIYLHLSRRVWPFELWDEQVSIALPAGRYVTAKGFAAGRLDDGPAVCGVGLRCVEPFRRWTKRFRGAGRVLDADVYRSGPVADGEHTPVAFDLEFTAMSPPFDFGTEHLDQAWGHGHYEQHGRLQGTLTVGEERFVIDGTGLRDHSWGPRDYREIGTTTWLHAQFPDSGRGLMAVIVTGRPPRAPFSVAVTSDATGVVHVQAEDLPIARGLEAAESGFTFSLRGEGVDDEIDVEIVNPLRAACVGPAELVLGTHAAPAANHHYIDAFARFGWNGDVGYGIAERTVDLTA